MDGSNEGGKVVWKEKSPGYPDGIVRMSPEDLYLHIVGKNGGDDSHICGIDLGYLRPFGLVQNNICLSVLLAVISMLLRTKVKGFETIRCKWSMW